MKTKITILLVVAGLFFGFTKYESAGQSKIEEGMIKVAIFYPNAEGNTFDMDYYTTNHMPMAAGLFGDKLKAMVIDKGSVAVNPILLRRMWPSVTFILLT